MSEADSLYGRDYFLWTMEQARLLRDVARSRPNLPLDWENLAEEIEGLGRSERRELRSRIGTVLEHLLKLELSPAQAPRPGWQDTIRRERLAVADLLSDNPSLRSLVPDMVREQARHRVRLVWQDLLTRREISREHAGDLDSEAYLGLLDERYGADRVLGDWFPDAASGA